MTRTCDSEPCCLPATERIGPLHLCAHCADEERAAGTRNPMLAALVGLDSAAAAAAADCAALIAVELLGFDPRDSAASRTLTPTELQAVLIAALRAGGAR